MNDTFIGFNLNHIQSKNEPTASHSYGDCLPFAQGPLVKRDDGHGQHMAIQPYHLLQPSKG